MECPLLTCSPKTNMSDFDSARQQFANRSLPPVEEAAIRNSLTAMRPVLERGMLTSQSDIFDLARPFFSHPELGAVKLVKFTNALISKWSDIAKAILKSIDSVIEAIGKLWSSVKVAVSQFFDWLQENIDRIVKVLGKILIGLGVYAVGMGTGVSLGAGIGIIFGPVGAAVGAGIGAGIGSALGLIGAAKTITEE